ncbi:hypothetical protein ACHAPT_000292 [Fusarium lateritium]
MSKPTSSNAVRTARVVPNFIQNLADGLNNAFTRPAADGTSQPSQGQAADNHSNTAASLSRYPHLTEIAWALDMTFASDLSVEDGNPLDWQTFLRVNTQDIPKLMREGFFWSEAHVEPEKGELVRFPCDVSPHGMRYCRTYYLDGRKENPPWTAQLAVHSYEVRTLANFRLGDLRVENVTSARAFRPRGYEVYYYNFREPQNSINVIYDDMPLKGWWPWPKEREEEVKPSTSEDV